MGRIGYSEVPPRKYYLVVHNFWIRVPRDLWFWMWTKARIEFSWLQYRWLDKDI